MLPAPHSLGFLLNLTATAYFAHFQALLERLIYFGGIKNSTPNPFTS
jgi:hypothetical protein